MIFFYCEVIGNKHKMKLDSMKSQLYQGPLVSFFSDRSISNRTPAVSSGVAEQQTIMTRGAINPVMAVVVGGAGSPTWWCRLGHSHGRELS